MYIYIYTYICVYTYIYAYMYMPSSPPFPPEDLGLVGDAEVGVDARQVDWHMPFHRLHHLNTSP